METVNIHQAKTHLSRLIAKAVAGEPFMIAKAGKPLVKVEALAAQEPAAPPKKRALGWLEGRWPVPDDIKGPFKDDIEETFHGGDELSR